MKYATSAHLIQLNALLLTRIHIHKPTYCYFNLPNLARFYIVCFIFDWTFFVSVFSRYILVTCPKSLLLDKTTAWRRFVYWVKIEFLCLCEQAVTLGWCLFKPWVKVNFNFGFRNVSNISTDGQSVIYAGCVFVKE